MKKFNFKPLSEYTSYANEKYIKPEKAGNFKEDMEIFRTKGQEARKIFTEIAKSLEKKLDLFQLQKVSSWMNQAQIARPYFWVFLKMESETREESGIALRLFEDESTEENNGKIGISLEVSFLERGLGENTIENQNKVLDIPIKSPLYYYVQFAESKENCVLKRIEGTEKKRKELIKNKNNKEIRKVLVKYDVKNIEKFDSLEELTDELFKGFELLLPYYEQTKTK